MNVDFQKKSTAREAQDMNRKLITTPIHPQVILFKPTQDCLKCKHSLLYRVVIATMHSMNTMMEQKQIDHVTNIHKEN